MAVKAEVLLELNGVKFSRCIKKRPAIATASNGIIFKTVVTSCSMPDVTTPLVLTQVRNHIADNPVNTAAMPLVASTGKKVLSALTNETAMAALEHQIEIQ